MKGKIKFLHLLDALWSLERWLAHCLCHWVPYLESKIKAETFKFIIFSYNNAVDVQKAFTKSGSSYGLRTVLNWEDEEPFSHASVDSLSPKITGILSVERMITRWLHNRSNFCKVDDTQTNGIMQVWWNKYLVLPHSYETK